MPIYSNIFQLQRSLFLGLLLIFATLSHFFDIPCPIRFLTGVPCPTCGVTRSFVTLTELNFSESFYYHPLTLLILPILFLAFYRDTFFLSNKQHKMIDYFFYVGSAIIFLVYLFRLYHNLIP